MTTTIYYIFFVGKYISVYWHLLWSKSRAWLLDALHLQYIGLGPAAVPVELPEVLHLGQADVGGDHPVAAGQVLLSVGECTETPQYYEPVVHLYEQRSKELAAATCSQP